MKGAAVRLAFAVAAMAMFAGPLGSGADTAPDHGPDPAPFNPYSSGRYGRYRAAALWPQKTHDNRRAKRARGMKKGRRR